MTGDLRPGSSTTMLGRLQDPNDQRAWDDFWTHYGPWIRNLCYRCGLSQNADVENVAQEVFIKAFENLSTQFVRKGVGSFRAWLARITQHQTIRYLKWLGRAGQGTGTPAGQALLYSQQTGQDAVEELGNEELELIHARVEQQALERIRPCWPRQVDAYLLFEERDEHGDRRLSAKQVAETLSMTELAVNQAVSRVRRKLREEMLNVFQEVFPKLIEELSKPPSQDWS